MDEFTKQKRNGLLSDTPGDKIVFSLQIDDRGRISIPADVRKSLGLSDSIQLEVSIRNRQAVLKRGEQGG